jgi:hypothetical protein
VLYRQADTVYNNGADQATIYIYSTDPEVAMYSLSFLEVGMGNGDYIPDFNGANGKVYKWVEPVGGVKQGNYLPASFLVAPKKQQVVSTGFDYTIGKHTVLSAELGYSNFDVNTFSKKDKANDKGYAAKIGLTNTSRVHLLSHQMQMITDGGYEYVDARFTPLERLRDVEFLRDWGLEYTVPPATEQLFNAGTQLVDDKNNTVKYQFSSYLRNTGFKGFRNSLSQVQAFGGWRFNNRADLTHTMDSANSGYFFRPVLDFSRQFHRLKDYTLGSSYSLEHNESRNKATDTVTFTSFSFETIRVYLKSPEKNPNHWQLAWFTRTNKYPFDQGLRVADRSQNINLSAELLKNEHHQFRLNATYRELSLVRRTVTLQEADKSLLGRAEYQVNEWKGFLTGNILYEVGAGQEQKRDYAFLEVPAGQGEYAWLDYNNDGIPQLNEFEIARFQDQARYIRIFTPSNEYIKAGYNTLNYHVNLNPRTIIDASKAGGMTRILSNINLQSSLQLLKKEINGDRPLFNPFRKQLNDTSLIALNSVWVNTLSYNRFSTSWGMDLTSTRNRSRSLLTYGYETRTLEEWAWKGRINVTRTLMTDLVLKRGNNTLSSSNAKFDNRNYHINSFSAEPRISYTRNTSFRFSTGYKLVDKTNRSGDREKYQSHSVNSELKYNILQNSSIQAGFTYTDISFKSGAGGVVITNSTVSYIMLDGLLPGKNYLWNVDLSKRLSNNLELTLQYEGRKPGSSRVVNIGRAAIRALL